MPEVVGRLRTPRLSTAPATPQTGEMYYDTDDNQLNYWNGTVWVPSAGHYAGVSPGVFLTDAVGNSPSLTAASMPLGIGKDTARTAVLSFTITPTSNCWWELQGSTLARVLDAAWYRLDLALRLTNSAGSVEITDAAGLTRFRRSMVHHSGSTDYAAGHVSALWALAAGTTYRCEFAMMGTTGGTWQYLIDPQNTYLFNAGARPRY